MSLPSAIFSPSLSLSFVHSLVEVYQVGSVSNNGYRSTRNLRDRAPLADTGITPEILENVFRNTADTCELRRNIGKDQRGIVARGFPENIPSDIQCHAHRIL